MTPHGTDIEVLVLRLLKEKSELSLREVAVAAGLSSLNEADRKVIRRVMSFQ